MTARRVLAAPQYSKKSYAKPRPRKDTEKRPQRGFWQQQQANSALVILAAAAGDSARRSITQSEASNANAANAVAESDMNILRQGSPFSPPCSRSKLSEWARYAGHSCWPT